MMCRWIGALLIVIGCSGCGFSMAQSCRAEERYLRQILRSLQLMQQELACRCTPLPELFRLASKTAGSGMRNILQLIADELEQQNSADAAACMDSVLSRADYLPASCRGLLSDLGQSLGCFDLDGQLQQMRNVESECQRLLTAHIEMSSTRIRSYQTLGLCAGASLAILML